VVPVRREIRVPVPGAQSQRCGAVWYTGDSVAREEERSPGGLLLSWSW
jgi:hypothetical protein